MLSQDTFDEMIGRRQEIIQELEKSTVISCVCWNMTKIQVQIYAYLRLDPLEQRYRVIQVVNDGVEVVGRELTPVEEARISGEITPIALQPGFKLSKAYYIPDRTALLYYLRPDWKYWHEYDPKSHNPEEE